MNSLTLFEVCPLLSISACCSCFFLLDFLSKHCLYRPTLALLPKSSTLFRGIRLVLSCAASCRFFSFCSQNLLPGGESLMVSLVWWHRCLLRAMIIGSRAITYFGSCSDRGRRALDMMYPFSLRIVHDLLPSHSCLLILLNDLSSRYPGKVICHRSLLNTQIGACVGWSWGP